jgi:predicted nucleotidyltransferase
MPADSRRREVHLEQLATIERLLQEYRLTKDRELLRQAIALWDEAEADRARLMTAQRHQMH